MPAPRATARPSIDPMISQRWADVSGRPADARPKFGHNPDVEGCCFMCVRRRGSKPR
jgi:hypothetical protein